MSDEFEWLVPPARDALTGDQQFVGLDADVQQFWRFALGDLRMNNARGYLAEFIVGKALGLGDIRRTEWDAYDLIWDGITIEVKSSAYLQSWDQKRISALAFTGLSVELPSSGARSEIVQGVQNWLCEPNPVAAS